MGLKKICGIQRFKVLLCLPLTSQGDGSEKAYHQRTVFIDPILGSDYVQQYAYVEMIHLLWFIYTLVMGFRLIDSCSAYSFRNNLTQ